MTVYGEERDVSGGAKEPRRSDEQPSEDQGNLLPLHEVERRYIERVLSASGGSKRRAAQILGITRWSLTRRLRKHGLAAVAVLAIATPLANVAELVRPAVIG